jgi:hypothetical protein
MCAADLFHKGVLAAGGKWLWGSSHWRRDFQNRSERLDVPGGQMLAHRIRIFANSALFRFEQPPPSQVLVFFRKVSN